MEPIPPSIKLPPPEYVWAISHEPVSPDGVSKLPVPLPVLSKSPNTVKLAFVNGHSMISNIPSLSSSKSIASGTPSLSVSTSTGAASTVMNNVSISHKINGSHTWYITVSTPTNPNPGV